MNISQLLFALLSLMCGTPAFADNGGDVELLFAGDAMQHQAQLDRALQLGGGKRYDYSDCFGMIAPTVSRADYAVVNLEVPLGGGPTYSGYPCFSAPDSYAVALKDAGFDMFLTANNHCLDRGDRAARRTLTALDSLGVDHIGTYHDAADRAAKVPFIKNIKGIKFGFLNYTYGTNGIEPKAGAEIALIDRQRIADEMKRTREAGAEVLVVTIHWGVEYVLLQNANQERLAKFLVAQGADLIIGGHPHVIQPMQVVRNEREGKDVLVVYSLGNFISNMKTGDTRGGAIVNVTVGRDEQGRARFKNAGYNTIYAAKPNGSRNFRVIPSWMPDSVPAAERAHFELFERGARRIFNTRNVGVPETKQN